MNEAHIRQKKEAADALAYEVAKAVFDRDLDERSDIALRLLNYLQVGHPNGPSSVPEWMDAYRSHIVNRAASGKFDFEK